MHGAVRLAPKPRITNRSNDHDLGELMGNRRDKSWSRREFLSTVALAGTGALLGLPSEAIAAEPSPETTSIRFVQVPSTCFAPQYLAEELLRADGFSQVQYVKPAAGEPANSPLVSGRADMTMQFSAPNIIRVDKDDPIIILAGVHVGCFEVFGNGRVRTIRDL